MAFYTEVIRQMPFPPSLLANSLAQLNGIRVFKSSTVLWTNEYISKYFINRVASDVTVSPSGYQKKQGGCWRYGISRRFYRFWCKQPLYLHNSLSLSNDQNQSIGFLNWVSAQGHHTAIVHCIAIAPNHVSAVRIIITQSVKHRLSVTRKWLLQR